MTAPGTVTGMTAVAPETTQGVQVELVIGGMTCAACAARVQAKLNKVTGVTASVNLSTERAYVSAPATVSAPDLIGVVEAAGYTAELARPAAQAGPEQDEAAVRRLRRRLVLALVFFVPLTDVSMMLSIFPWTRFPGWQWLLVSLAVPVATWAAWPFHAAALRQARHLSSSMDTLVSLGILAACGWSAYAMFVLDRGRSGLSGLQNLLHGSGGGIYLEAAASVTTFLLAGRCTRPGRGAPPARPCGSWPRPEPGTSACWTTTVLNGASRPPCCAPASGSWSGPESASQPTARSCPASPRWTAAR